MQQRRYRVAKNKLINLIKFKIKHYGLTNDDGLMMDSSTENTVLNTDKHQFIVHG